MSKLWLDDVRPPWLHGCIGYEWVKTAEDAITLLATGKVTKADLDHDLSEKATLGDWDGEATGFEVVCWMRDNNMWPVDGVHVHSVNEKGRERMQALIDKFYGKPPCPHCKIQSTFRYCDVGVDGFGQRAYSTGWFNCPQCGHQFCSVLGVRG